jgi:hypothetical protein
MSTLESDKVEKSLRNKMEAEREDAGDWFFIICDDKGDYVASTSLSKGAKHTLGEKRVNQMAHQLRLSTSKQFVDLVQCTLSRDKALKIMKSNPPSSSRMRY